jgi:hypothetical protein
LEQRRLLFKRIELAETLGRQGGVEDLERQLTQLSYQDFNAELKTEPWERVLIPPTAEWKWLHPTDGKDPAADLPDFHQQFFAVGFDDSSWSAGRDSPGPFGGFGYGEPNFTGVDLGHPGNGQRYTAYFRHRFTSAEDMINLEFQCQRDDGIFVYLDGKEVVRDHISFDRQRGNLSVNAYHLVAADGVASNPYSWTRGNRTVVRLQEAKVQRFRIPGTLKAGEHVIAISLHNHSNTSSDLRIAAMRLVGTIADP